MTAQDPTEDHVDRILRALADPVRRTIVARLSRGPAGIRELTEPLAITKQAVSRHVAVLADAGLVVRTGEGRLEPYRLRPEALEVATGWLDGLRLSTERRYRRLDAVLGDLAGAAPRAPAGPTDARPTVATPPRAPAAPTSDPHPDPDPERTTP